MADGNDVRITNRQIFDAVQDQGRQLQRLVDASAASQRLADDHERRLRDLEANIAPLAHDAAQEMGRTRERLHFLENWTTVDRGKIDQLERTMSNWSKAMWGLVSGLFLTVVGAVLAYGMLQ